jgi:hypothetical protein
MEPIYTYFPTVVKTDSVTVIVATDEHAELIRLALFAAAKTYQRQSEEYGEQGQHGLERAFRDEANWLVATLGSIARMFDPVARDDKFHRPLYADKEA